MCESERRAGFDRSLFLSLLSFSLAASSNCLESRDAEDDWLDEPPEGFSSGSVEACCKNRSSSSREIAGFVIFSSSTLFLDAFNLDLDLDLFLLCSPPPSRRRLSDRPRLSVFNGEDKTAGKFRKARKCTKSRHQNDL